MKEAGYGPLDDVRGGARPIVPEEGLPFLKQYKALWSKLTA